MPVSAIEFATDTTRSIGSVLFSGTASRYPDIRWIWSHSGGTMPFLLSRFDLVDRDVRDRSQLPTGSRAEMRKFFYDTAQGTHKGALEALLEIAPTSQLLFGTDFPLRPTLEEVDGLRVFGFAENDLRAIEHENALRLLPRLRR